MLRSILWPLVIVASAIGAGLAMAGDTGPPVRPVIAFWFLLICPGMAVVRLLRVGERAAEVTLAVALSIAIDTLVAEALVLTGLWSPERALFVLIVFCLAGAGFQLMTSPALRGEAREAR